MGEVLAQIISIVFTLLSWAIIIRILLSWLPLAGVRIDPYHPAIRALYAITDPILEPLRKYTMVGTIDLSPIVAILALRILEYILLSLIGFPPNRMIF